jgi:ribosomal-protein-alanine N-acetyltransferase
LLGKTPGFQAAIYNGGVKFTLRDYQPQDFERLWQVDQLCFVPGIAYSRRELSAYIRRRGAFTLVAEETASGKTGPISGFIVAEANRRGMGHIISIDVLPESRRAGLGSQLLTAAESRLRTSGCHTIVLETAVDNASAIAFYKRFNYSVTKISPGYYSNGVDALVLEKDLEEGNAEQAG